MFVYTASLAERGTSLSRYFAVFWPRSGGGGTLAILCVLGRLRNFCLGKVRVSHAGLQTPSPNVVKSPPPPTPLGHDHDMRISDGTLSPQCLAPSLLLFTKARTFLGSHLFRFQLQLLIRTSESVSVRLLIDSP